MYAKLRSIRILRILFDKMSYEQIILWIAIIIEYARNGYSKESIKLFEKIEYVGINQNDVTFISLF